MESGGLVKAVALLLLASYASCMTLRARSLHNERSGEEHGVTTDVSLQVGNVADMMKTMTVAEAQSVLGDKLPPSIKQMLAMRSAQHVARGPDAPPADAPPKGAAPEGVIGKPAPTSQPPCEKCKKISADQKTKDEALKVLNELIKEEVTEHDIVEKECVTKITKVREIIETINEEIKTIESNIADATSRIARETGKIQQAETEITKIKEFLVEHTKTCTTTITEKKTILDEIQLQEDAAEVLKNATTCVKKPAAAPAEKGASAAVQVKTKASLIQCGLGGRSFITFENPELRKAHLLLAKKRNLAFMQAPAPKDHLRGKVSLIQSMEVPVDDPSDARVEEVAKRCKINNPEDIIGQEGFLPKGPVPVNCGILNEEFSRTHGEIKDERITVEEEITEVETQCEEVRTERTKEQEHWENVNNDANSALADAVSDKTTNEELLVEKTTTKTTEERELTTVTRDCTERITHVLTRLCSIEKLRVELIPQKQPPQDCEVGPWSDSECVDPQTSMPKTCGGGVNIKKRSVLIEAAHGGASCPALEEPVPCNTHECPVDCILASWSTWGSCSAPCDSGVQMRSRPKVRDSQFGGMECGATQEEQVCNMQACDQPCVLGEWGDWGPCSKSCMADEGDIAPTQERSKDILVPKKNDGTCPAEGSADRSEVRSCNANLCPERPECVAKMDLVIVVDASGSIGAWSFGRAIEFLQHLVNRFVMSNDGVNIGVIRFADGVDVISPLGSDKAALDAAIGKMEYTMGVTNTAGALTEARTIMKGGRQDAASVVLVLTDGNPDSDVDAIAAANHLKADAARLFMVMIHRFFPLDVFKDMATKPVDQNVLRIKGYAQLDNALREILVSVCPVIQQAAPATACKVDGSHVPDDGSNMVIKDADDKEYDIGATVADGVTLYKRCSKATCRVDRAGDMGTALCDNGALAPFPRDGPTCNCEPELPPVGPAPEDMPPIELPPASDLPPAPGMPDLPPVGDFPPSFGDLPPDFGPR